MNAEQAWAALVTLEKAGHSLTKNIVDRIKQAIAGGGELDNYLAGKLQYELNKHNAKPQEEVEPDPVVPPDGIPETGPDETDLPPGFESGKVVSPDHGTPVLAANEAPAKKKKLSWFR
jgi:hypothetical protein